MLDGFKKGELPNLPSGPLYPTDVATFEDIYHSAMVIELECVVLRHSMGYQSIGKLPHFDLLWF